MLNKEQIEDEGWVIEEFNNKFGITVANKGNAKFMYQHENNILDIWTEDDKKHVGNLFRGEIKSINEFRTICKWLNI